jgi:hypothetical protein
VFPSQQIDEITEQNVTQLQSLIQVYMLRFQATPLIITIAGNLLHSGIRNGSGYTSVCTPSETKPYFGSV